MGKTEGVTDGEPEDGAGDAVGETSSSTAVTTSPSGRVDMEMPSTWGCARCVRLS
jgi:hypothetical protein